MVPDTMQVLEFDWGRAMKKRNYEPKDRPDLLDFAREAMQQALDAEEASARRIEVEL
ncbi:MAG: hypothetical protein KDA85_00825 [Planctomycetaceae bacterium]|nr:hypothetical protein [Planctomycetaceae bacterium]